MGEIRQHEERFQSAPATYGLLVRLAKRLHSMASATKQGIECHDQSNHTVESARSEATGQRAHRAEVQLRTEQVVSFTEVCCAKRSSCGL
jgi:hypothetical protein